MSEKPLSLASMTFTLAPQLEKDTFFVADLPLCRVLLMNNCLFPWLILVPRRNQVRELFELSPADYTLAMEEVRHTSSEFQKFCSADKMNIAALGNVVPQLHVHIIARFENDPAWPKPVWNSVTETYTKTKADQTVGALQKILLL